MNDAEYCVRQSDYIYNVCNQVYSIDDNVEKYKLKMNKLIEENDISNLTKQLFWKPNVLLSLIVGDSYSLRPFFVEIASKFGNKDKFVLFVLNCLFHLSLILLNHPNDENNKLLRQYFNFNNLGSGMVGYGGIFGINGGAAREGNVKYKMLDLLFKQKYFNGINQIEDEDTKQGVIRHCITTYCYDYLVLVSKYFDKNSDAIKLGINHTGYGDESNLQMILVGNRNWDPEISDDLNVHPNKKDWVNLLFQLSEKSNELINIDGLKKVIKLCEASKETKRYYGSKFIVKHNASMYKEMVEALCKT